MLDARPTTRSTASPHALRQRRLSRFCTEASWLQVRDTPAFALEAHAASAVDGALAPSPFARDASGTNAHARSARSIAFSPPEPRLSKPVNRQRSRLRRSNTCAVSYLLALRPRGPRPVNNPRPRVRRAATGAVYGALPRSYCSRPLCPSAPTWDATHHPAITPSSTAHRAGDNPSLPSGRAANVSRLLNRPSGHPRSEHGTQVRGPVGRPGAAAAAPREPAAL